MNFELPEDRSLLLIQSPTDIKTAVLVKEFDDDHIVCASALINGVEVDLFWCGSKTVGAFEFFDESPKAGKTIFNTLSSEIAGSINMMFDFIDEDLVEEYEKHPEAYRAVVDYVRQRGAESSIWKEVAGYKPQVILNTETMTLTA